MAELRDVVERQAGVSFRVHRILGQIENEAERFAVIANPPAGRVRWSPDEANRRVGYRLGAERAELEAYERQVLRERLTESRSSMRSATSCRRTPESAQAGTAERAQRCA